MRLIRSKIFRLLKARGSSELYKVSLATNTARILTKFICRVPIETKRKTGVIDELDLPKLEFLIPLDKLREIYLRDSTDLRFIIKKYLFSISIQKRFDVGLLLLLFLFFLLFCYFVGGGGGF